MVILKQHLVDPFTDPFINPFINPLNPSYSINSFDFDWVKLFDPISYSEVLGFILFDLYFDRNQALQLHFINYLEAFWHLLHPSPPQLLLPGVPCIPSASS